MTREAGAGTHPTIANLVSEIHRSAVPLVLVVTGGGSGAIASLLEVPGASRTVLEAAVPYAPQALAAWLGAAPEQACAPRTARAMAMAAYQRARGYLADPKSPAAGLACTASLATDRPKHGEHRMYVALQTGASTLEWPLVLTKGRRTRGEEEAIAQRLLLNAAAEACGLSDRLALELSAGEQVASRRCDAPAGWRQLLAGEADAVDASGNVRPKESGSGRAVFPGAFNPRHEGHRRMAELAAARLGLPIDFELSITNVDKPPLDFLELRDRAAQFAGQRLWLTTADTFVKKSRIFPGATFIVGIDTLERIAQPRYYGNDPAKRDAAILEIAQRGCRFLVFGRQSQARFCSLATLRLPETLSAICDEVSQSDFRHDISSTALRAADRAGLD
jgi:nicotinamide mononucleotide (NMN) deamidase PncC